MFYNMGMDVLQKFSLFADQMALEPDGEAPPAPPRIPLNVLGTDSAGSSGAASHPCGLPRRPQPAPRRRANAPDLPISHAVLPDGRKMPLLKTLLTSACERNCYYCPFRAGRNYRRTTFQPEELGKAFMDMQRAGMVEGIFLSSGIIKGGISTQDRILDTAEILRHKLGWQGYLHLKIMPGAEKAQVERAMQLADRISVNLEGPNTRRLQQLAPLKQFMDELLQPLQWAEEIRKTQPRQQGWKGRWPSLTTQFVVGAVGESDLELLTTAGYLYQKLRLSRTYFSGFHPVQDTPLAEQPPVNPWREHRLYQASFLLRDYGFDMEEMPFDAEGNLPLDADPKLGWARTYLREMPVEVNRASRETLLRVPGIGPKGAAAILRARRRGRLRDLADLRQIGVVTSRLAPFVLLDGRRPPHQLRLFQEG
jgi:predicted DNA-binding helix-hairpin-helix protein